VDVFNGFALAIVGSKWSRAESRLRRRHCEQDITCEAPNRYGAWLRLKLTVYTLRRSEYLTLANITAGEDARPDSRRDGGATLGEL
jgi:hypothetical protein